MTLLPYVVGKEARALRRLLYLFGLKSTWDFPVKVTSRKPMGT